MNYKLHHVALSVRNLEESLKFYEKIGFHVASRSDREDGSLSMVNLKLNDIFLEVVWYRDNQAEPQLEIPYDVKSKSVGIKHIAFYVDDINEAFEDIKQKGLADDTTKIEQSRTGPFYFFIKDPDGVWVEFIYDNRDH